MFQELIKDRDYYIGDIDDYDIDDPEILGKLPGGVTFSGGESLLQMNELENVLCRLHSDRVHIAIETSLFANPEKLEIAMKYVNLFYVDIKIIDKKRCREALKGNLDTYYCNLSILVKRGGPIVARIPVIADFTDDAENRKNVTELLGNFQGEYSAAEPSVRCGEEPQNNQGSKSRY